MNQVPLSRGFAKAKQHHEPKMTLSELAPILGILESSLRNYARRDTSFPEPALRFNGRQSAKTYYSPREVKAWWANKTPRKNQGETL